MTMGPERTITHQLDPSDSVPMGVVEVVAVAENERPIDLPPLHEAVDTTRLESLTAGDGSGPTEAEFEYYGYAVTVRSDRTVTLVPLDGSA